MRKFVSWAVRGLIVLSPLALAMTASAATPSGTVPNSLRAAMQRDLGLTSSQLTQYLKIERLAALQEKQLAQAQGRNFAGSWIERKANGSFQLVVATTSITPKKPAAGVEFRSTRHTLATLDASKAQLDAVLARGGKVPRGVYGWYVDMPTNSVVVSVGKGAQQAGINFVAASGADAQSVRLVTAEEQPRLRSTLQGGLGYLRNPGDGYLYACSIGFTVTQGSTPGYVSAGHCGDANEPVYLELSPQWTLGPKIGNFAASKFPNPGQTGNDYSWIRIDAGHTSLPAVYGWGKGDVTVRGSTEAAVGAAICRSGRTSGWRCGTIEAKNQTVSYSTGETILNLTRTTACSEGGDSGGSFITGPGQAQGVLSGGSGSCKGKQPNNRTRSFYQPLLPILQAYNLTLRTGT
ncbi:S1 family peptidase [Agrilutibacter solisilvae]|uniref:S1 family peptidase n=1 Tax=Agrilutibacter solisilvae TaxID=2763317 RepID=A0A975ASC9_9GAMM|nr:S1 family peptidase [Lysobacter solisilvae]QSX77934.1 S1 family peptidase [Lysobacter solisilvae]